MALRKTLETPKGPLQIEIKFVQMVEGNQKKLIEMTATNIEHKFFVKDECRIAWNEEGPSPEVTHAFERKAESMFNYVPLADRGYSGKL